MPVDTSHAGRFVGNYELLDKIAVGGMGAVYRGRHRQTGLVVAIKIVPPEAGRNPLLLRRFEQEFRAASVIDHPNVVKALDFCGSGPTPFLVMEFVEGESLGQRVERDGAIPEAEAVRLIGQVCEGLHRAHKQGLIHRDVKPDNILVTPAGVAKLTDLGLVKDVEAELNLTKTGRGLGTPHFMAPEQFRNAKNADVRCDIYSLGATLYMLVTGKIPFDQTTPLDCWVKKTKNDFLPPQVVNRAVGDRTNWAVCRAMDNDPVRRPASCREFMEDLMGTGWRAHQGSGGYPAVAVEATPGPASTADLPAATPPPADDLWYLVYRDPAGEPRTVKGTTDSIRRNVLAATLGDAATILVNRSKVGQFQPLRNVPEFRDLVVVVPHVKPSTGVGALHLNRVALPGEAADSPDSSGQPTAATGPATARVTVAGNSTAIDRTVVFEVNPAASLEDVLAAELAPATEAATPLPPAPRDWTPWVLLAAALIAAILGFVFLRRVVAL